MKDVLILEKEEQPGYHATGRAAGVLVEFDLVPSTVDLKIKGGEFLRNPPQGFFRISPSSGIRDFNHEPGAGVGSPETDGLGPDRWGVEIRTLSPAEVLTIVPAVLWSILTVPFCFLQMGISMSTNFSGVTFVKPKGAGRTALPGEGTRNQDRARPGIRGPYSPECVSLSLGD